MPVGARSTKVRCAVHGGGGESSTEVLGKQSVVNNPLLVKEVIWYFSDVMGFGTRVSTKVCAECAQKRIDEVLNENSWAGNELTPDEEQHGRFSDEEIAGRQSVVRKQPPKWAEGVKTMAKASTAVKENETVDAQENVEVPTAESAPAAAAPKPKPVPKSHLEEFPVGTIVEFIATDIKGNQGTVQGEEEKRGVNYIQVLAQRYTDGRVREGKAEKVFLTRATSLKKVDALKEWIAPVVAAAPAESAPEDVAPAAE